MNLIYHKTSSIGEIPLSRTIYKAMQGNDCKYMEIFSPILGNLFHI